MNKLELYDVSFTDLFGYIAWARSEEEALEFSLEHEVFHYLEDELISELELKGKMTDLSIEDIVKEMPEAFWKVLAGMAEIVKIELDQDKSSKVFEYISAY